MSTEVVLFDAYDVAGRPHIKGIIDANGNAQLMIGANPAATLVTDSSGNAVGIADPVGGGNLIAFRAASFTPYRLAIFGDSRANSGSHLNAVGTSTISGERVPGALCRLRGDMQIIFNGGISGDTAINWNSAGRASSSQTVKDLIAAAPDLCYIQYGINDFISGTSASTVVASMKALIDKILGAGIPVVLESCNPCAPAAVSYINGYSATGGFGASAPAKLLEMQNANSQLRDWVAQYPSNLAIYVDSAAVTTGSDGYAKTDQTYYDGTHMSRKGCKAVASMVDSAINPYFPRKSGQRIKMTSPNGLNRSLLNQSSGRADNFSAISNESGTATATYQCVIDSDGDLCQEYNVTVSALSGGTFRIKFDMLPDWVGATPFNALVAGDLLQGAFDYVIDDGYGGSPIAFQCYGRSRVFYNDASNEFTEHGSVAQIASTDFPRMEALEAGKILTPRLPVKVGMSSANMLTTTALQCYVAGNMMGVFRLRIKNPQWGKVL